MQKRLKSLATSALCTAYFLTQVALGHAAETNFWKERRLSLRNSALDWAPIVRDSLGSPGGLSEIPHLTAYSKEALSNIVLPYGSIRDVFLSKSKDAPLVIHIQDVHDLEEAQANIAHMVLQLRKRAGVELIGMEGASQPFQMGSYRTFPNKELTKKIGSYFLKQNYIGGPEYAALISSDPLQLEGVEDETAYRKNIEAYKDSQRQHGAIFHALEKAHAELKARKEESFSPELREIDRHVTLYNTGKEPLSDYLKFLVAKCDVGTVPWPNIERFSKALSYEAMLDFSQIEKERSGVASQLANVLTPTDLQTIADCSLRVRAHEMPQSEFYRAIADVCKRNNISLDHNRQLTAYMDYVLVSESIQPEHLLKELVKLEEHVISKLTVSDQQKLISDQGRYLGLLEDLAAHQMTPDKWERFESTDRRVKSAYSELNARLVPSVDFCRYALRRNQAFVDNLLRKMKRDKIGTGVLIAGGFHSDGLVELLKRKDVSYMVVTPRISHIDGESHYLDVLARDPLPIVKLFIGEKIGLVSPRVFGNPTELRSRMATGQFLALQEILTLVPQVLSRDKNMTRAQLEQLLEKTAAVGLDLEGIKGKKVEVEEFVQGKRLTLGYTLTQFDRRVRFRVSVTRGNDKNPSGNPVMETNFTLDGETVHVGFYAPESSILPADILAPIQSLDRFRTGWKRWVYYLVVAAWEEIVFRGLPVLVYPSGMSGSVAMVIGFMLFMISHYLVARIFGKEKLSFSSFLLSWSGDWRSTYIMSGLTTLSFAFSPFIGVLSALILAIAIHFIWDINFATPAKPSQKIFTGNEYIGKGDPDEVYVSQKEIEHVFIAPFKEFVFLFQFFRILTHSFKIENLKSVGGFLSTALGAFVLVCVLTFDPGLAFRLSLIVLNLEFIARFFSEYRFLRPSLGVRAMLPLVISIIALGASFSDIFILGIAFLPLLHVLFKFAEPNVFIGSSSSPSFSPTLYKGGSIAQGQGIGIQEIMAMGKSMSKQALAPSIMGISPMLHEVLSGYQTLGQSIDLSKSIELQDLRWFLSQLEPENEIKIHLKNGQIIEARFLSAYWDDTFHWLAYRESLDVRFVDLVDVQSITHGNKEMAVDSDLLLPEEKILANGTVKFRTNPASIFSISPDGRRMAVVQGLNIEMWDLSNGERFATFSVSNPIKTVSWYPSSDILAILCADGLVWSWVKTRVSIMPHLTDDMIAMTFESTKRGILGVSKTGKFLRYEPSDDGWKLTQQHGTDQTPDFAKFSPDGKLLALVSENFTKLQIFDVATMAILHEEEFQNYPAKIKDIAFAPDGQQIGVLTDEKDVLLIFLASGKPGLVLLPYPYGDKIFFSPDSKKLLHSSPDGKDVYAYDLKRGTTEKVRVHDHEPLVDMAFSSDGTFYTMNSRSTVRSWSYRKDRESRGPPAGLNSEEPLQPEEIIPLLAFLPDAENVPAALELIQKRILNAPREVVLLPLLRFLVGTQWSVAHDFCLTILEQHTAKHGYDLAEIKTSLFDAVALEMVSDPSTSLTPQMTHMVNFLVQLDPEMTDLEKLFSVHELRAPAFIAILLALLKKHPLSKYREELFRKLRTDGKNTAPLLLMAMQSESFAGPLKDMLREGIESGALGPNYGDGYSIALAILSGFLDDKILALFIRLFRTETNNQARNIIGHAFEVKFSNGYDLLVAVYGDEKKDEINQLDQFLNLKRLETQGFTSSLLSKENGIGELLANVRLARELLPTDTYQQVVNSRTSMGDISMMLIFGRVKNRAVVIDGYEFDFPVNGSVASTERVLDGGYGWIIISDNQSFSQEAVRERQASYDSLIDANFDAIHLMSDSFTKATGEKILELVAHMVDCYTRFAPESVARIAAQFSHIKDALELEWTKFEASDTLPDDVRAKITQLELVDGPDGEKVSVPLSEMESLHSLLRYMHENSFSDFMSEPTDSPPSNVEIIYNGGKIKIIDLNDIPSIQSGQIKHPALSTLFKAIKKVGNPPNITAFIRGARVSGFTKLGYHKAEFEINLSEPDKGGVVSLRFCESGATVGVWRLPFMQAVLRRLGMKAEIIGHERLLLATLDKNTGAVNAEQLERVAQAMVRVLYYTKDFDIALNDLFHEINHNQNRMQAIVEHMAAVFLAEGTLPFYSHSTSHLQNDYESYKAKIRNTGFALVAKLNQRLEELGLPLIPDDIAIGQAVFDDYYNRPIALGVAHGELVLNKRGVPEKIAGYKPLVGLAKTIVDNEEEAFASAVILEASPLDIKKMKSIGRIGGLSVFQGVLLLVDGRSLLVNVLVHPQTNDIFYARGYITAPSKEPVLLGSEELRTLLQTNHQYQSINERPMTELQKRAAQRILCARIETAADLWDQIVGSRVSDGRQGMVIGRITTNRKYHRSSKPLQNPVLLVDFTTPNDIDAIRGATAVLATAGGILSHVGITTREFGIPAVIYHGAEWKKDKSGIVVRTQKPQKVIQEGHGLWITSEMKSADLVLNDGDLVLIDGANGTTTLLPQRIGEEILRLSSQLKHIDKSEAATGLQPVFERIDQLLSQMYQTKGKEFSAREDDLAGLLEFLIYYAIKMDDVYGSVCQGILTRIRDLIGKLPRDLALRIENFERELLVKEIEPLKNMISEGKDSLAACFTIDQVQIFLLNLESKLTAIEAIAGSMSNGSSTLNGIKDDVAALERRASQRVLQIEKTTVEGVATQQKDDEKKQAREVEKENHRTTRRVVYSLGELGAHMSEFTGPKAANLGEVLGVLREQGGLIPEGLAVTVEGFLLFLQENNLERKFRKIADQIDDERQNSGDESKEKIEKLAVGLQRLIRSGVLQADRGVGKRVLQAVRDRNLGESYLAVRSSAVQEDTQGAAYAGVAETHLFVQAKENKDGSNELLSTIVETWASFWLPRAVAYRGNQSVRERDVNPALVIQRMINNQIGGVTFTADPNSGANEILTNAGWGLTEGVVRGEVSVDQYVTDPETFQEKRRPVVTRDGKNQYKFAQNQKGPGTEKVPLTEAEKRTKYVLTPEGQESIARMAVALKAYFGYDLDIEWGIENGQIYIFQVRPLTTGLANRYWEEAPKMLALAPVDFSSFVNFYVSGWIHELVNTPATQKIVLVSLLASKAYLLNQALEASVERLHRIGRRLMYIDRDAGGGENEMWVDEKTGKKKRIVDHPVFREKHPILRAALLSCAESHEKAREVASSAQKLLAFYRELMSDDINDIYILGRKDNTVWLEIAEAVHQLEEARTDSEMRLAVDNLKNKLHNTGSSYLKDYAPDGARLFEFMELTRNESGGDDVDKILPQAHPVLQTLYKTVRITQRRSATADLLEPFIESSQWAKRMLQKTPVRFLYYVFVGSWEVVFFMGGPLLSGPVFFLLHPILRWLIKSKKQGLSWENLRREISSEFETASSDLFRSRFFSILLLNIVFTSFNILTDPTTSLVAVTLVHIVWDFLVSDIHRKNLLAPLKIELVPDANSLKSHVELAKIFDPQMNQDFGSERVNVAAFDVGASHNRHNSGKSFAFQTHVLRGLYRKFHLDPDSFLLKVVVGPLIERIMFVVPGILILGLLAVLGRGTDQLSLLVFVGVYLLASSFLFTLFHDATQTSVPVVMYFAVGFALNALPFLIFLNGSINDSNFSLFFSSVWNKGNFLFRLSYLIHVLMNAYDKYVLQMTVTKYHDLLFGKKPDRYKYSIWMPVGGILLSVLVGTLYLTNRLPKDFPFVSTSESRSTNSYAEMDSNARAKYLIGLSWWEFSDFKRASVVLTWPLDSGVDAELRKALTDKYELHRRINDNRAIELINKNEWNDEESAFANQAVSFTQGLLVAPYVSDQIRRELYERVQKRESDKRDQQIRNLLAIPQWDREALNEAKAIWEQSPKFDISPLTEQLLNKLNATEARQNLVRDAPEIFKRGFLRPVDYSRLLRMQAYGESFYIGANLRIGSFQNMFDAFTHNPLMFEFIQAIAPRKIGHRPRAGADVLLKLSTLMQRKEWSEAETKEAEAIYRGQIYLTYDIPTLDWVPFQKMYYKWHFYYSVAPKIPGLVADEVPLDHAGYGAAVFYLDQFRDRLTQDDILALEKKIRAFEEDPNNSEFLFVVRHSPSNLVRENKRQLDLKEGIPALPEQYALKLNPNFCFDEIERLVSKGDLTEEETQVLEWFYAYPELHSKFTIQDETYQQMAHLLDGYRNLYLVLSKFSQIIVLEGEYSTYDYAVQQAVNYLPTKFRQKDLEELRAKFNRLFGNDTSGTINDDGFGNMTPSLVANVFRGKAPILNVLTRILFIGGIICHELGHWVAGPTNGKRSDFSLRRKVAGVFNGEMPWATHGPKAYMGIIFNALGIFLSVLMISSTIGGPFANSPWLFYAGSYLLVQNAAVLTGEFLLTPFAEVWGISKFADLKQAKKRSINQLLLGKNAIIPVGQLDKDFLGEIRKLADRFPGQQFVLAADERLAPALRVEFQNTVNIHVVGDKAETSPVNLQTREIDVAVMRSVLLDDPQMARELSNTSARKNYVVLLPPGFNVHVEEGVDQSVIDLGLEWVQMESWLLGVPLQPLDLARKLQLQLVTLKNA